MKNQVSFKEGNERQPFQGFLFRTRQNRGKEWTQLLIKPYSNNTLQEDKEGVRMNLLIAPSISSTDLLSPSQFFKMHPLAMNLIPVKMKHMPSAGRVKHFVKNGKN